ncbi:hypothetical protein [Volucribacter amazonae]|uniref:DUF7832 domain-containing protein n=1 Tax=Volucribacter amazonae TaxID=256731 RepID=A0A9X4SJH0_9PAST|nr:hypothetical protein [Volucribacter amazonae]MDG6894104.1 hypothetical protein [Volucribacter amazonae]
MKYDDQNWHINENFPEYLDSRCAMTHMGYYMAWIVNNDLVSDMLKENFPKEIDLLLQRKITGVDFIITCCDNKITSDDMNELGNLFSKYYYEEKYFTDYVDLCDLENESIFDEPNTWSKYDKLSEVIDVRYQKWLKRNNKTKK